MTAYGDLFHLAFRSAADEYSGYGLPELVAAVVRHRDFVDRPGRRAGPGASLEGRGGDGAAAWIGDALAYDVALAFLCQELGVAHGLGGPDAGPRARADAERRVAARLPALTLAFSEGEPR